MTPRERIINALTMKEVDQIPWEGYWDLRDKFPMMVDAAPFSYGKGRASGDPVNCKGSRTDAWGSGWIATEDGVIGEVKSYPIDDWSKLDSYTPPWDVLDQADLSQVNEYCKNSDKFVIHFWEPTAASPFQRMQYLRGTEQLFMDLAYDDPEVYQLRDMVHAYYKRQVEMWCETDIDAIHLEDDWGTQISLLISPEKWREFFKPLYKEYCDIAHSKGKYVVMHSDGYIIDIIEDLIEIGVNAINAQIFCMDMEELERRFGGRICFWGEIDRQHILPFGSEEEIRAAVRKVANVFLKNRKTGLVAMCPAGKDITMQAVRTVYDEWSKISKEIFGK